MTTKKRATKARKASMKVSEPYRIPSLIAKVVVQFSDGKEIVLDKEELGPFECYGNTTAEQYKKIMINHYVETIDGYIKYGKHRDEQNTLMDSW
jgi:hypothetical protein